MEEAAIELAVTGPSYRQAANTLETLLGYRVISHEAIRQHLLDVEMIRKEPQSLRQPVLSVEVDGLYLKRQEKGIRGREEKIAAVHQGWELNGKRVKLKEKRHYVHRGKVPFWEGFETFLIETYDYDPTVHRFIINGDERIGLRLAETIFRGEPFSRLIVFMLREIFSVCFVSTHVIVPCEKR